MNEEIPEMEIILAKLDEVQKLEASIENLKSEISNVIVKLRNTQPELLVRLSTKTGYKGKFYSVRKLGATGYYICTGDKPFGSWLKKKDKKNVALESA